METITPEKLKEGCQAIQQRERRDAVYETATFLVGNDYRIEDASATAQ